MADSDFGLYTDDSDDVFSHLLRTSDSLNSDSAKVLVSMVYDHMYSICDHNAATNNPLSPVAKHPVEIYEEYSGLYRAIERFEIQDIANKFGLSLLEYLSLPRDVILMMSKIVVKAESRMEAILRDPKGDPYGRT